MTALSIKNSILMFLIVFILHFLIKNALADRSVPAVQAPAKEAFSAAPTPVATPACPAPAVPERNTDAEKAELLKYVFGDNAPASCDDAMAKYFQGTGVAAATPSPGCLPLKDDARSLPLSTTCDPALTNFKSSEATKKASIPTTQPLANKLLLNEYANENGMNGGLFGGLNPFDGSANMFQEYAPCV